MIDESSHTETLVIHNLVTEVDTIDSHLVSRIRTFEETVAIAGDRGAVGIEFRVVSSIGVHVRALEEVNADGRRLVAVSLNLTGTINIGTVVAVAETTRHIATHIVILGISQIGVNPLGEIGIGQTVCGTVDDFVRVECHVVELVVRGEAECLTTNLKSDRATAGLGVRTGVIVEDPEEGLIALQHMVGVDHTIGVMPVGAVVHQVLRSSREGVGSGKGNVVLRPRTEVVVDVIVRVVTVFRIIDAVVVDILEGSEEVGVTLIAMGGPVGDAGRHHISGSVIAGDMSVNLGTGDFEEFVEFDTHGLCRAGTRGFQGACPIVVTDLSESHGGQFQLAIDVKTTNPQTGTEHGCFIGTFGDLIFSNFLEPHRTTSLDVCTNIVHGQLIGAGCRKTRG